MRSGEECLVDYAIQARVRVLRGAQGAGEVGAVDEKYHWGCAGGWREAVVEAVADDVYSWAGGGGARGKGGMTVGGLPGCEGGEMSGAGARGYQCTWLYDFLLGSDVLEGYCRYV